MSTSGAPFLEVAAGGVNKATGLEKLCGRLGIDRSEVIAFGDNNNDVEMLGWVGHGVAMGNALPEVAGLADEVTLSNDEDGVALVVERLAAAGWAR
ncbi:HAD-IIB family hydrolase [Tessaracoccus coleopterorum]|uniref:HAD-IIB family hydrolase n=1 Tax=Tessaracoccus coleopterorum TaxID=2714950 RepID=UPI002F916AD4